MGDSHFLPVLVGPFAGPVQGVSIIDNALRARMAARGLAPAILELSPGSRRRGLAYHAVRMGRAARGMMRILGWAPGPRRRYVMSLDGGSGLLYNIALVTMLRFTGQQVMFYHHSSGYVLAENGLMRVLMRLAGKVPQVFCSEKMARQFLERYGIRDEVLIISNTAWITPLPASTPARDDGVIKLGFLSALNIEKGLGRAIETLRALRRRGIDARLSLAGDVSDAAAQAVVEKARVEFGDALVMRGVVRDQAKTDFLTALDYFLFPSLYPHETQSLVVPEALAAGVPVITFDHRFVSEVLGTGGLLLPSGADFPECAADWIQAGDRDSGERRLRALSQFEADHRQAAGQVDRLIAWSVGR